MATIRKVPISDLIEDKDFYPRMRVDDQHVRDLFRVLQTGGGLPPLVADMATLRLIDGWHRKRAWELHLGRDAEIKVELRSYDNDVELYLDAVQMNASHGRKLNNQDRIRIVVRAQELGIGVERISGVIHVPERKVTRLVGDVKYAPTGEPVPLKRGESHMRGKSVTFEQLQVSQSIAVPEAGRLAKNLSDLIESDSVPRDRENIREQFKRLSNLLATWLQEPQSPAA